MIRAIKLITLLAMLGLLIGCLWPVSVSADDSYSTNPSKWTLDLREGYGDGLLKLVVGNQSTASKTFAVTHWFAYTSPSEGEQLAPKEWITKIVPESIELPPGGETTFNVQFSVPQGAAADGKYKTWLKVSDSPHTEDRVITVSIRLGAAVPSYEFVMNPGFYQLSVTGHGDAEQEILIGIRNSGSADCTYDLYVPRGINSNGLPWRDGNYYQPITQLEMYDTYEEICSMVKLIDESKGLTIPAYGFDYLRFNLFVPKELPNGYYEARIGSKVSSEQKGEGGAGIGIQYECRLLITVNRDIEADTGDDQKISSFATYFIPLIAVGAISVVGYVVYSLKTGKRKRRVLTDGQKAEW